MTPATRTLIERRLAQLEAHTCPVIDADVHLSDPTRYPDDVRARIAADPGYFHGKPITAEEALAEMDQAGVDMALCWQNPSVTRYGDDQAANHDALLAANRYVAEQAEAHPARIVPAGWTDPKALGLERALALVETCVRGFGFAVVKMNPAQNAYRIDDAAVLAVVARIVELGAIPAFHYGADTPYTPAAGLARVAEACGEHPVIGVHMGGGGAGYVEGEELYQQTRALGLARPNLFFVLSAKRDAHAESDLIAYQKAGAPYCHNIACASDAPYGRMAWNFGGYRLMFQTLRDGARHTDPRLRARPDLFDDAAVANYLGDNVKRLVLRGYRAVLAAA